MVESLPDFILRQICPKSYFGIAKNIFSIQSHIENTTLGIDDACQLSRGCFVCIEDDVNTIATDVMAYLQQRPMASDTLDGVVYWWLIQHSIIKKKCLVEQALKQLVDQGKVSKTMNANHEVVYSLGSEFKRVKD